MENTVTLYLYRALYYYENELQLLVKDNQGEFTIHFTAISLSPTLTMMCFLYCMRHNE